MKFIAENIPQEMRSYAQWVVAGDNKIPMIWNGNTLVKADPVGGPWMDFDSAVGCAGHYGMYIGFVLTQNDPFTCIDLDTKDCKSKDKNGHPVAPKAWTAPSTLDEIHNRVLTTFTGYQEVSKSQKGVHIFIKGDIGQGFRKYGMEVYSHQRYIIVTGFTGVSLNFRSELTDDKQYLVHLDTHPAPIGEIIDHNEAVNAMVSHFRRDIVCDGMLEDLPQILDDEEILRRCRCGNDVKFLALMDGDYHTYHGGDHSRADAGLMQIFCHYSPNREQVLRLFMSSGLAQREKAHRADYIAMTYKQARSWIMLQEQQQVKAREHGARLAANLNVELGIATPDDYPELDLPVQENNTQAETNVEQPKEQVAPEPTVVNETIVDGVNITGFMANLESMLQKGIQQQKETARKIEESIEAALAPREIVEVDEEAIFYEPSKAKFDFSTTLFQKKKPLIIPDVKDPEFEMPWPPGKLGELARQLFCTQYKLMRETSIIAAVGFIAGICGRGWYTHTGKLLNIYIALTAETGTGKEAVSDHVANLSSLLRMRYPDIDKFTLSDFASAQGLKRSLTQHPCQVSTKAEIGKLLSELSARNRSQAAIDKEELLLTLFDAAVGKTVAGKTYSKKENDTEQIVEPSWTLLGTATPDELYALLDENLMNNGFVNRLMFFPYQGDMPETNPEMGKHVVSDDMVRHLESILCHSVQMIGMGGLMDQHGGYLEGHSGALPPRNVMVVMDEPSLNMWTNYGYYVDGRLAHYKGNSNKRSPYTRAAIKAMKLACLCAVMENHVKPVVREEMMKWAIQMSQVEIACFHRNDDEGNVGKSLSQVHTAIHEVALRLLKGELKSMTYQGRDLTEWIRENKMIPVVSLVPHLSRKALIRSLEMSPTKAIKTALHEMDSLGTVNYLDKRSMIAKDLGFTGDCIQVLTNKYD